MDGIPAWAWKQGAEIGLIAYENIHVENHPNAGYVLKVNQGAINEAIARALVAERERARSIAKGAWLTCDFGSIADADTMNDLSVHIADLIGPDSAIRKAE